MVFRRYLQIQLVTITRPTVISRSFINTTGNFNTAAGAHTLVNNTTGSSNIALGINAGNNLTTGNNNIDIGNGGVAGEAATTRIGTAGIQTRTLIAGVTGVAVAGSTVVVNASRATWRSGFFGAIQGRDQTHG